MTLAEVRKLQFRDSNNKNDRVPTLVEALQLAKKNSTSTKTIKVFVEIKNFDLFGPTARRLCEKVADVINQEKAESFACVIAFSPVVIYHMRSIAPQVECCILYRSLFLTAASGSTLEKVPSWLKYVAPFLDPVLVFICVYLTPALTGCTMVGPESSMLSQEDLLRFRKRNLTVYVWVTNTFVEAAWYKAFNASFGTDWVFPKHYGLINEPKGQPELVEMLINTTTNTHPDSPQLAPVTPRTPIPSSALPSPATTTTTSTPSRSPLNASSSSTSSTSSSPDTSSSSGLSLFSPASSDINSALSINDIDVRLETAPLPIPVATN